MVNLSMIVGAKRRVSTADKKCLPVKYHLPVKKCYPVKDCDPVNVTCSK